MSQSRTGRTMSLAVLVALVAALAMWMRSRSRPIQVDDPPEWPPLPPLADDDAGDVLVESLAESVEQTGLAEAAWRSAGEDGACPDGFPVKANETSGIFHVPGGRFYDRTKPDRCYPDAASAIADGYRQAKS